MKKYDKDPLEELTAEQLKELLHYSHNEMPVDSMSRIKEKVSNEIKKETAFDKSKISWFKRKKVGVILGAVAALTLMVGYTQRDELKMAYYQLFGTESEKLLSQADKLSETVTDQGFRLTATSSFEDGDSTYVFTELTDLEGDRLSEDTLIDRWEMLNGGNTRVVGYDEATKTATLLTSAIRWDDNKDYGFQLNRIIGSRSEFKEKVDLNLKDTIQESPQWIDISQQHASGGGYHEESLKKLGLTFDELGKNVLKPGVFNKELSEEYDVQLVNAGFKDGLLHLLIKEKNDMSRGALFTHLVNEKTGEQIDEIASIQVDEGTHSNVTGQPDYTDIVYDVSPEELENYSLHLEGWKNKDVVEGNWAIKLKKPKTLEKRRLSDVTLQDTGLELSDITLSGLSLQFTYSKQATEDGPIVMSLLLKDGTEKEIFNEDSIEEAFPLESDSSYQITFPYRDVDAITSVLINGQPLELK